MRIGAPGSDYLRRGIVGCGGAPIADTAYMGLTSCLVGTIMGMVALQAWERGVVLGRDHHIEPVVQVPKLTAANLTR